MAEEIAGAGRPAPVAKPAADDVARSNLERELLRAMRRLDFRIGQERIVVLRWNGVRLIVLPTEQV